MNTVAKVLSPTKQCFLLSLDIYWCVKENAPFSHTALDSQIHNKYEKIAYFKFSIKKKIYITYVKIVLKNLLKFYLQPAYKLLHLLMYQTFIINNNLLMTELLCCRFQKSE